MDILNMQKKPEIIVFAGPNGSGKSTITKLAKIIKPYINADDIKSSLHCSDIEAAQKATLMRESYVNNNESISFETVLSTSRNLDLLIKAKQKGYFIRVIYVLTVNSQINVYRVKQRFANGGHDVPKEKVISRYENALKIIPELVQVADVCHIYDNSLDNAFRIFKKRKDEYFYWENILWSKENIEKLVGYKFQ